MYINKESLIFCMALVLLWMMYMINRAVIGFEPISDEVFYLNTNIENEYKRIYFLHLVQFFEGHAAMLAITVMNVVVLIISFFILVKINLRNSVATFFQLVYFCAIAAYVFRDALILFMFVSITYLVFRQNYLYRFKFLDLFTFKFLTILVFLILLLDFRGQYVVFIIVSFGVTKLLIRFSNRQLLVISFGFMGLFYYFINVFLNSFFIYGISVSNFLEKRVERHEGDLTPISLSVSLIKHFFAPLPTSLFERGLYTDSIYSSMDDLYRMFYKGFIYIAVAYILVNTKTLLKVLIKWRAEMFFLTTFSLLNATMYTLFSFGGGHERTKVFSVFFIVFAFSAIMKLKKDESKYP